MIAEHVVVRRLLAALAVALSWAGAAACGEDDAVDAKNTVEVDSQYATATTTVGEQPEGRSEGGYVGEQHRSVEDLVRLSAATVDGTIISVRRAEPAGPPDDLISPRVVRVRINAVLTGELKSTEIDMVDGYWNAGPDYFGSFSSDGARFGQVGERALMFITPDETGDLWHPLRPSTRFFINRGDLVRNTPDDGDPVIAELAELDAEEFVARVKAAEREASGR